MSNLSERKSQIEKYLNHEATAAERLMICQWIKEDKDIKEWFDAQLRETSNDINAETKSGMFESICGEIDFSQDTEAGGRNLRRHIWFAAVACIAVVIATVFAVKIFNTPGFESKPLTIYTNIGDRSHVTLPDGTDVHLNSVSKISFCYDAKNKCRVACLSGEAFFDVAPDSEHPFYVHTSDIRIECLGTKFNVNAYPENKDISVVLSDGKVKVVSSESQLTISPNTMVSYDKEIGLMTKQYVESTKYCEWMNGYLYFNNERFEDIARAISRNYGVTVNILSQQLKNERFTGSIYHADVDKLVNVLTAASGAKCNVINDTLINLTY